jgi:hypothetical protein
LTLNAFDEVRAQVEAAKDQLRAADHVAGNMAWLLRGRLRHVASPSTLKELKRELRDFDMARGRWKA